MLLKRGDNNANVKTLQLKLGLEPIGNYGPNTEAAVKKWQLANGLPVDGIIGNIAWNKLMGIMPVIKAELIKTDIKPVPSKTNIMKLDKLKGHIPDDVFNMIPDTVLKFEINTPLRLAHFLSQCSHESNGFKVKNENLNYSSKGLLTIFKKYFPSAILAAKYEKKPAMIANKVYSSRMGNGDEKSGDGYKFRGRGYIQLTGKQNYTLFGKSINEDICETPDKISTDYPLLSAAWFFTINGLHKIADTGATDLVVKRITERINGGTIGLDDRIKEFKIFYSLLS